MRKRLVSRFLSARGEVGIVPIIAGSAMFMIAVIGVVSVLVLSVGVSAMSQTNSELTAAMRSEIQAWEKTPWSEIQPEYSDAQVINWGGRGFTTARDITYHPELTAYTLTLAAARAVAPGTPWPDCAPALTGHVDGCITLGGSVTATSDDVQPETPQGITLSTEQVDSSGQSLNLIEDANFEAAGSLSNWVINDSTRVAIETVEARAAGTQSMTLTGSQVSVTSPAVPASPGDQMRLGAWAKSIVQGSSFTLGYRVTFRDGTTSMTQAQLVGSGGLGGVWQPLAGVFTVPPAAASVAMTLGTAEDAAPCSTCKWAVDDVSLTVSRKNLVSGPDFEVQPTTWTLGTAAAVVSASNRVSSGERLLEFTGSASTARTPNIAVLESTEYYTELWVRNAGTGGGTGTIDIFAMSAATRIDFASVAVTAVGTDWIRVFGTAVIPAGVNEISLYVTSSGASPDARFQLDDSVLYRSGVPASGAGPDGYITVASIAPERLVNRSAYEAITLRLSFKYLGAAPGPDDMRVAVFCNSASHVGALAENAMAPLDDAAGNGIWYWSRIALPDLGRLSDCERPSLRIYSQSGNTPATTEIGSLFVLRVLVGVKTSTTGVTP